MGTLALTDLIRKAVHQTVKAAQADRKVKEAEAFFRSEVRRLEELVDGMGARLTPDSLRALVAAGVGYKEAIRTYEVENYYPELLNAGVDCYALVRAILHGLNHEDEKFLWSLHADVDVQSLAGVASACDKLDLAYEHCKKCSPEHGFCVQVTGEVSQLTSWALPELRNGFISSSVIGTLSRTGEKKTGEHEDLMWRLDEMINFSAWARGADPVAR